MPKLVHRAALIKTSTQLTAEQYRVLTVLAKQEDRKIAYFVRKAVDEFIARRGTAQQEKAA